MTAGASFFSAFMMYGAAQWLLFANTEHNLTLECKKTDSYGEFTKFADRRIEAVETP